MKLIPVCSKLILIVTGSDDGPSPSKFEANNVTFITVELWQGDEERSNT